MSKERAWGMLDDSKIHEGVEVSLKLGQKLALVFFSLH